MVLLHDKKGKKGITTMIIIMKKRIMILDHGKKTQKGDTAIKKIKHNFKNENNDATTTQKSVH